MFVVNLSSIFSGVAASAALSKYGYIALFGLMVLESASLPIPSEVVLPVAGLLAARGLAGFNFYVALLVAVAAGIVGITIDYFIAYFVSKDVVYKHLQLFHIKRETLDGFDSWFNRNGVFAVFSMPMVPVLRGLVSFPAGFAAMPKKQFYAYSILGSLIWDVVLMSLGYYALQGSVTEIIAVIAIMGVALYALYLLIARRMKTQAHQPAR